MRTAVIYLAALATFLTQGLVFTSAATAAPTQAPAAASSPSTEIAADEFMTLASALRASDTPRTTEMTPEGIEVLTFNLEDTVFLRLPYRNGSPYIPPTPRVGFGAVWWSAYIELNSAEQAALAAGSSAAIVGALTRNAATAGIATTIIAVATANGICSGGRTLRIYFPSFLMSECR